MNPKPFISKSLAVIKFTHGIDPETKRLYHCWDLVRFMELFSLNGELREEQDIKAIIYTMGGPLPSELLSYELAIDPVNSIVKIYLHIK